MEEQLYTYHWCSNEKQVSMKGRTCKVIARAKMNSCWIEFLDNGQQECVSRFALRKIK